MPASVYEKFSASYEKEKFTRMYLSSASFGTLSSIASILWSLAKPYMKPASKKLSKLIGSKLIEYASSGTYLESSTKGTFNLDVVVQDPLTKMQQLLELTSQLPQVDADEFSYSMIKVTTETTTKTKEPV
jgi:hypothetical protein